MNNVLARMPNGTAAILFLVAQFSSMAFMLLSTSTASATAPDWLDTTHNITFSQSGPDVTGSGIVYGVNNTPCETHLYKYQSSTTSDCMVHVSSGYISSYGNYFLTNNAQNACQQGNNKHIQGLPNQDRGYIASGTPWGTIQVYTNLGHDLLANPTSTSCSLSSTPSKYFVTDAAGHNINFNFNTIATSNNGQWILSNAKYANAHYSLARVNTQTGEVLPFGIGGNSSHVFYAISDDGRYAVAWSNPTQLNVPLTVYDLSTCASVPNTITDPVSCSSRSIHASTLGTLSNFINLHSLRFTSSNVILANMYVTDNGQTKQRTYQILAPGLSYGGLSYLALGDSYSSGEGAGSYLRGTEVLPNMCHTSTNSYPNVVANTLNYGSQFRTVACSGAVTDDVITKSQHPTPSANNVLGEWLPGLNMQARHVTDEMPGIMTITMGGNDSDVEFRKIVIACLEAGDCYDTKESRKELAGLVNSKFSSWVALYKTLISDAAPDTKLYVVGYPQIVSMTGSCALNVRLTDGDREFANHFISYLNYVISQAASRAGAIYVNTENSLNGHKMCEASSKDVAVNGVTAGADIGPFSRGSFHPNKFGQNAMAQTIMSATSNFSSPSSAPTPNTSVTAPIIPSTPVSGTPIYDFLNPVYAANTTIRNSVTADTSEVQLLTKGQTFTYHLNGIEYGFKPWGTYNASLNSNPYSLGNFTADADGDVDISITIPNDVDPGIHLLNITGQNTQGENIKVFEAAYVKASPTDFDGDGNANTTNGCDYFADSGVDADQDGIDDGCDSYIGIPPLYRARNGVPTNGEDPSQIYIDRNSTVASGLGFSDYNPSSATWVPVAQASTGTVSGSAVANFSIEDLGYGQANAYDRYKPNVSVRSTDNGCAIITPSSLASVTSTSGLNSISVDSTNTDTCRSASASDDVDSNSVADNAQAIYRARNGNSSNGEDPTLIYIERNNAAAEALLGLSDYDPDSDGWSVVGVSGTANTGTYSKIAIVDSAGALVSSSGTIPSAYRDAHTAAELKSLKPEIMYDDGTACNGIVPVSINVVKYGETRLTQAFTLLSGQTCI